MPKDEDYNLTSQIRRAATSVSLSIAEGSITQTDMEQRRFVGMAIRSLVETIACLHLIKRRGYVEDVESLRSAYRSGERLFIKLQALRNSLGTLTLRDESGDYSFDSEPPF